MRITKTAAILFIVLFACLLFSGCTEEESDIIVGTWEWSDNHGYIERYTFHQDHSFFAEALGSTFSGTWEMISPDHYTITYCNDAIPDCLEPRTETVIYDESTDAVYFPAHGRVG